MSFISSRARIAMNVVAALGMACAPFAQARVQDRLSLKIDDTRPAQMRGNIHPLARAEHDAGRLDPAKVLLRVALHFNRTAAQQAGLEKLLEEQQDPASPNYHRWLTPEQFADRFSISAHDLQQVSAWLEGRGFTIVEQPPSRSYIAFSGTVAQVDSIFRTEMHRYVVDGEEHFANSADPVVPVALAAIVLGFRGLHDFRPNAHGIVVRPRLTSYISGNHFLVPDDFATIYNAQPLYNSGIDGTGVKIAVVGQTDISLSDIQTFRRNAGLIASDPQIILAGADPGTVTSDLGEASLDIEWAGAVARGATIVYVNSTDAFTSWMYAINHNVAPIISSSYGACERTFSASELTSFTNAGQQANSQGITLLAASGDQGAADCETANASIASHGLGVDMPAAMPTVTGVGGTTINDGGGLHGTQYWSDANDILNGSALSYIPETAWNDSAADGVLAASGGGASSSFLKPAWQTGTGVPNDSLRDVPDVAFAASADHDGYIICAQGSCVDGFRRADTTFNVIGGTSVGTRAFAGVVALINQVTGSAQGNVNPRLYQLAAISSDAFHDITTGSNIVDCTPGTLNCPNSGQMGYSAGAGYDQVTGLGTINIANLVNEWVNVSITPNPIAFGTRLPNTSTTLAVTLRNNNGPALNISGISISGNFSQTNNCPGTLAFSVTCTINVSFLPTAAGQQNGTLTVTADDSNTPHQIAISGTGADVSLALARTSRVVRADANTAPPTSSAQPAATAATAPQLTAAAPNMVTAAGAANSLVLSTPRMASAGGVITIVNPRLVGVAIAIDVPTGFHQENDCGDELAAGASCRITVTRERAEASGEMRITTPNGTARVRLLAEQQ